MKLGIVCIVVLALIFSCQSKVSEDENNSKKTYLSHQIEELVIELNDSLMNDYPYSSRYISEDGQLYLIGFNESYHKLDIFNLDQSKFEFDIPLEKEGPNAVIDPNIVFHEGKIIYSFPIVPDIFVYDMKTKIVESYLAKSDLNKRDLFTLNKEDYRDIQNRMIARIENPYYYHVIPDNKNDLYYRIHTAGIKYDLGNEEFGKGSDKSVYIQILDDDFDTIEEIELPKNTYDALSTFVNKEGDLLIPKTHYLNPDLKEDKLIFDKFIFKFK